MSRTNTAVVTAVLRRIFAVAVAVVGAGGWFGEASGQIEAGTVERVTVPGASLKGNLSNDPADRDVSVHLPPSYASDADRRYPVS